MPGGADAAASAGSADEHLPTTRLPPLPAPPAPSSTRAAGATASGAPPPPASRPSVPPSTRPSEPPVSLPLTRAPRVWRHWTDSLVLLFRGSKSRHDMVVAAPRNAAEVAGPSPHDEASLALRRRLGVVSTAVGLVLVVCGVALGLRGVPVNSSLEPVVVGALIVARALAGLGVLAFGTWLLRLGERLLLEKP